MSDAMDTSNSNVTLRMIIPGREIGVIIGKGGETIHQIRAESEAKIFISDGSVPERVITVTGSGDAVSMAYNLMCGKLEAGEEGKGNRKDTLNLRLVVAAAQCGSIIGKSGSKIKEIRESCGASVNVGSDLLPSSTERCVTVAGPKDKAVEAIYQIVSVLASKPLQGSVVQYKPGVTMGPYGGGQMGGGNEGRRGGGGMGMGGGMGGMGGGGGGMGGMGGMMGGGAGPLAALASMAGPQLRRGGGGEETHHTMTVPNEHIGSIIGKGGSKVAEIRQMSGANVQISKGTDKDQANSAERTINISGTAEAVTLAKNLINMSLELHQLDGGKRDEGGYDHTGNGGDHGSHDYRDYGYGNMGSGSGAGVPGLGAAANREVMKALATLSHFNNITGGNLFGEGGYAGGMGNMGRGGRNNGSARGQDRSSGAPRSKFSPY